MTEYSYLSPRSDWAITFSVWKALFLREAVARIASKRGAWVWLLVDPILHVIFMILMFTFIRMREVGGIEVQAWLIVGVMSYSMFRSASTQGQNAISANRSLFSYRQVKPVDTILVRVVVEGLVGVLVTIILGAGALLFDIDIIPYDILYCFAGFLGMWLMGVGYGLMTSVAVELIPETAKFFGFIAAPLYILSGVILPLSAIPPPYSDWLLLNPLAHGVEAARVGISHWYHPFSGLDLAYLYECAIVAIFLGLALHRRFAQKLVTL